MTSHTFLQILVASGIGFQGSVAQTPPPVPLALRDAVALVLSRNPALVESGHVIEAARARADQTRSGYLPTVEAEATYGVKNGYIPNIDILRGNIVAAVDLRVPLFDGNRTRSMEEEAAAALHAAESHREEVALMIQAEVDQALSELTAAEERVGISETNINQADLAVKNARLRYGAGSLSNLDLLDAETAVAQARLTNLQALYDVVTGTIRLRRATGSAVAGE